MSNKTNTELLEMLAQGSATHNPSRSMIAHLSLFAMLPRAET
jgi:hypothetical protein